MIKLTYGQVAMIVALDWVVMSGVFILGAIWQSANANQKLRPTSERLMVKPGSDEEPHTWCPDCRASGCCEFVKVGKGREPMTTGPQPSKPTGS